MVDKRYATAPRNLASLSARIRNLAPEHRTTELRLRSTVGNVIIGQMLPSGAIKGGTGLQLRHGESRARFSADVDVARAMEVSVENYIGAFRANLERGWHGFTGAVVTRDPATPEGVPVEYVMAPFDVKLSYQGRPWFTVLFELGCEEVAVLPIDHQIAQKLHACSAPGSDRAHDLVDLQILASNSQLDLAVISRTAQRLFGARKRHAWPPVLAVSDGWATLYEEAATGIEVLPTVDEAVVWANRFINTLESL